jgi:hypothetical protein
MFFRRKTGANSLQNAATKPAEMALRRWAARVECSSIRRLGIHRRYIRASNSEV